MSDAGTLTEWSQPHAWTDTWTLWHKWTPGHLDSCWALGHLRIPGRLDTWTFPDSWTFGHLDTSGFLDAWTLGFQDLFRGFTWLRRQLRPARKSQKVGAGAQASQSPNQPPSFVHQAQTLAAPNTWRVRTKNTTGPRFQMSDL